MYKSSFILFLQLLLTVPLLAQVKGVVTSPSATGEEEALPGVNIVWAGTTEGGSTNAQGKFSLKAPDQLPAKLVFSYVGFQSDTINVTAPNQKIKLSLKSSVVLEGVTVQERKQSTSLNLMSTIQVEELNSGELERAACCNLSEAFETNASVDVVAADGVTGSKKIQMLGLDGVYTSMQFENFPFVRGLAAMDGLSNVPGTWVESIQISKGTGSVLNGYEPMTGQINIELIKPDELDERVFVNLYGNNMGRMEANVHVGDKLSKKWSTLLLVHSNTNQIKIDNNNDGFMDLPIKEQVNVMNRWKYKGDRYRTQFGVRAMAENKSGGQLGYNPDFDYGTTNHYGTSAEAQHVEAYFKNGFLFKDHPKRTMAFFIRANYHDQKYQAGLTEYDGTETYIYLNYIYADAFKNSDHRYKVGASFVYDDYDETFRGTSYQRTEQVPGIFGEYTYKGKKFGAVAGLRGDFHNLYGNQVSPKLNVKYNFNKRGVVRGTLGRGFRVANIFTDNVSTFVSQRQIQIQQDLQPEVAWNTGLSATQKFQIQNRDVTAHLEYFYTHFENQVLVDRETPGMLAFYNLDGQSFSHAVQAELSYQPWKVLELRVAAKYLDVKATYQGDLKQVPLVPNWRGLFSIGYQTLNKKWQADLTTQFVGEGRMPSTIGNAPENVRPNHSDAYALINAQLTRRFRKIELYAGVENLGNFQQPSALISADDPFNSEFDASLVWGPLNGRVIYGGLRLKLFKS
ncbi:TonB-dependent receptor [bacterium SCSIO 12741]|nr:TonB-dependent receptor [bacterium SCSIO 12741]